MFTRSVFLLAAYGLLWVFGCATQPREIAEPVSSAGEESDLSSPEGTLRLFLSEATHRKWGTVRRLSRTRGVPENPLFDLERLISQPDFLRIEFSFRKAPIGTPRRVADLTLVRQEGRFRGKSPLEMVNDRDRGWVLDYGWEHILSIHNFNWYPEK